MLTHEEQFEYAKELLARCDRAESRDHTFGDREVYWTYNGVDVADGYFGGGSADVYVLDNTSDVDGDRYSFKGEKARELSKLGKTVTIGRNDETGPDEYRGA